MNNKLYDILTNKEYEELNSSERSLVDQEFGSAEEYNQAKTLYQLSLIKHEESIPPLSGQVKNNLISSYKRKYVFKGKVISLTIASAAIIILGLFWINYSPNSLGETNPLNDKEVSHVAISPPKSQDNKSDNYKVETNRDSVITDKIVIKGRTLIPKKYVFTDDNQGLTIIKDTIEPEITYTYFGGAGNPNHMGTYSKVQLDSLNKIEDYSMMRANSNLDTIRSSQANVVDYSSSNQNIIAQSNANYFNQGFLQGNNYTVTPIVSGRSLKSDEDVLDIMEEGY